MLWPLATTNCGGLWHANRRLFMKSRQDSTVGPFLWAIGHLTIYYVISLFINGFWQMRIQNDCENVLKNEYSLSL